MPFEDKNPQVIGSELLIQDDDGNSVASIDSSGVGSFQDLTVVQSPTFMGMDFETEWMAPKPNGLKAYGLVNTVAAAGITGEYGLIEVAATNVPERNYQMHAQYNATVNTASCNVGINIRYEYAALGGSPAKPTLTSALMFQSGREGTMLGVGQTFSLTRDTDLPAGEYRFLVTALRQNGTGNFTIGGSAVAPVYFSLKDNGPAGQNIYVLNPGAPGGTTPVQTYVTSFNCTWSRSYKGDNNPGSFTNGNSAYQGYNDSANGIRRASIGFDWPTIQSVLAGSTVTNCTIRLYFQHWWSNAGGTAVVGTHNYTGTSAPGVFWGGSNIVNSGGWPKPGLRTVTLGAGIGDLYRTGNARGISLGPPPNTSNAYYGYAAGQGSAGNVIPQLTFYYTK